jgi:Ca-activated chloride channel homolog
MNHAKCAWIAIFVLMTLGFGAKASTTFESAAPCSFTAVQSNQDSIRSETNLQSLAVRVTDGQGNDVHRLSADDFELFEDGRPQKIDFFGAENVSTGLAVLVGSSSSMDPAGRFGSAEEIAARFLRNARPGDEISAMDFSDQLGAFQTLNAEQTVASPTIPLGRLTSHGSALYDAIATTICRLRASRTLQQAIVVISDGVDQHSRVTLAQLVSLVQESPRVQLFMIGLYSRSKYNFDGKQGSKMTLVSGREIDNPVYVFDLLAKESGAEAQFLKKEEDIGLALQHVSDVLRAQYTVAYYPEPSPKSVRRIEVRVKLPGLRVATRRVVGPMNAAGETVQFVARTCSISPERHPYPFESKLTEGPTGTIYHEDFLNPRSGWPNHPNSLYGSGRYEMTTAGSPIVSAATVRGASPNQQDVVAAYGPWWQNFRASVVVDPNTEESYSPARYFNSSAPLPSPSSAGLVFRLNDEGYYALLVSAHRKGGEASFEVLKRQYRTTAPIEVVRWTRFRVPQTLAPAMKISVECRGNQIMVFVNDQEVGRAQDPSYSQGYAGLIVSGDTRAIFRDLVVEEIP